LSLKKNEKICLGKPIY